MLQVQRSRSRRNEDFGQSLRKPGEGNVAWVTRHAEPDSVYVLLLGGRSTWAQRLRTAQAQLRHDLSPSHWSHVALLGPRGARASGEVHEIPLLPRRGLEDLPLSNGVVKSPLKDYDDPQQHPNVGIVALPLAWAQVKAKVEEFKHQRTTIDALELQLAWLTFTWAVGRISNPLYDRIGFASAALLEYVASALAYDLTPAFPSGSSCPEAIWQAALYWYETPRMGPTSEKASGIRGAYALGDGGSASASRAAKRPSPSKRAVPRASKTRKSARR